MTRLLYFAYGSNLHPLRLRERAPSAKVIGVVEAGGRKLCFSKRGVDGSGKCSFHETGCKVDVVFGVLYALDASDKGALDKAEGKGSGYNEQLLDLKLDGVGYSPFAYVADSVYIDSSLKPYEWYKQFVLIGAKYHSMPEAYISWLETFEAVPDPDAGRAAQNMTRLATMVECNRRCEFAEHAGRGGALVASPYSLRP